MNKIKTDFVIIGAGMLGLSMAHNINKINPGSSILILEKEDSIGQHSSGRNSGVLHAGIYYKPNSLKAKVCVEGAKRLKEWCAKHKLKILNCGKIITTQSQELDPQIDLLMKRGKENGAKVELIDKKELKLLCSEARSASGRAIWSPDTSVVNPKKILKVLLEELLGKGIKIIFKSKVLYVNETQGFLKIGTKDSHETQIIEYGHSFNVTGIHALKIANLFSINHSYEVLPFKGTYWELDKSSGIKIDKNLYPVPNLNIPFLGVHFTPSLENKVYVGPTAIPALGRENYKLWEKIDPGLFINSFQKMGLMWLRNKNGFRGYATNQMIHFLKPYFLKSAQLLIPRLKNHHLISSEKIGIRAQLYNNKTSCLEDDFIVYRGTRSTHVLNAISPAFTSGFSLSELIFKEYFLKN